jgi:hypothetical protein
MVFDYATQNSAPVPAVREHEAFSLISLKAA